MRTIPDTRILIRGAGDLASGVAYRLAKAGFPVIMTDRARPLFVRRAVCFGNAIYETGPFELEGLISIHIEAPEQAAAVLSNGSIPVLIDEQKSVLRQVHPAVVVDARMQKHADDTQLDDAPLVIALGPGFTAGQHCHAVVETQRGHRLGRVIWDGQAQPNTGTPGRIDGYDAERVLRATGAGNVIPAPGIEIGRKLERGTVIATLNNSEITAPFPGVLRGLIHPSVSVWEGLKIGDIDPRGAVDHCFTISDKSLAVGGGVLEAVLSAPVLQTMPEHK